jgi:hypothetical protein
MGWKNKAAQKRRKKPEKNEGHQTGTGVPVNWFKIKTLNKISSTPIYFFNEIKFKNTSITLILSREFRRKKPTILSNQQHSLSSNIFFFVTFSFFLNFSDWNVKKIKFKIEKPNKKKRKMKRVWNTGIKVYFFAPYKQ